MKAALIQLHAETLARLLGLPEGAYIDAVYQRPEDLASDSFTLRVRGVGRDEPPGNHYRYHSLDELCVRVRDGSATSANYHAAVDAIEELKRRPLTPCTHSANPQ